MGPEQRHPDRKVCPASVSAILFWHDEKEGCRLAATNASAEGSQPIASAQYDRRARAKLPC